MLEKDVITIVLLLRFNYFFQRQRVYIGQIGREKCENVHSAGSRSQAAATVPALPNLASVRARCSSTRATFCYFLKCVSTELDWKWNSQDAKWCSHNMLALPMESQWQPQILMRIQYTWTGSERIMQKRKGKRACKEQASESWSPNLDVQNWNVCIIYGSWMC